MASATIAAVGRYSPSVSDDFNYSGRPAPSPVPPTARTPRRSSSTGVVGWLIAAVVVLILAVAGGLLTAWIVANMRAVPGPVAFATSTPAPTATCACASLTPPPSASATLAPRFTPTPLATVEITPAPFTYVVQPGDHLVNIAAMFQVDVQDIIDLNGIKNPDLIAVGKELLIPGYGIQPTPKPTKPPK